MKNSSHQIASNFTFFSKPHLGFLLKKVSQSVVPIILLVLMLSFDSKVSIAQTQLGADIDGEADGDNSGCSVSLSSDGQTVAIGAYINAGGGTQRGQVRVYKLISGTWTLQGSDIDGEANNDQSGWSVSLSSDGQTVAIGANGNDGTGSDAGHVRVYKLISGTWTLQGTDIDGEASSDQSGYSVFLSSDGQTVAIGAIANDGTGNNAGHVRVYKLISGTWTLQGTDIDGEAANDMSGISVSLSSDGQTVAIGAYNNAGGGTQRGHVRVYKLISGTWTLQGTDIDGEADVDQSGYSVSLSSDGQTVAIGAFDNAGGGSSRGHVRVYKLISGTWTLQGNDIDGEADNDNSGYSVSLSSDGQMVAIGALNNAGGGSSRGHVRVYKLISGTWTLQGTDIDGEADSDASGYSVSLSSDGQTVAIGAQGNAGGGSSRGHVRVYQIPSQVSIASFSQTNIACNGSSSGTATVSATSGNAPYTYSWSPSGGTNAAATNLAAGNYTVTVTDAASSSATQTFTITQPSALSVSPSQTNIACNGGETGVASVSVTGGYGAIMYNWAPSGGAGSLATSLTAGTYTVTITDANSCTAIQTFNITAPSAISVTPSSQTNVSCFGGNTGAASINTPTGGAGGFSYNWTPGNPTGDGTVSVTGLTAGTWTCTVTDANSCTATRTFNITAPTAISVTFSSQTNVSCFGGVNGAASVNTPTGGAGGFSYNWTPGNPTGDGTVSVTGLTAGTWTCTVTDANSCTATRTFNITAPSAISVTPSSQTNISCNGGANGAASINTPTGGAGGFSYNWTPGNPTGDGTVSVTGLTAGTWTCTVTDANSCTATQTFNITAPSAISVTPSSQTNIACNGGANGAASINTASGGAGGYVYDWTPGNPTGDGTLSVTGLTATTYTVTVTDANSCEATQTLNITEPAQLSVASSSQVNECIGGSNGTATVSMTGGTTNYTYSWSPSGGSASTGTGLSAGNYTVTVTDANGCSTSQTFTIHTTTEFTYTGNSPDDWLDEGNWSPCYPGTNIASGSTVIVSPGSNLVIPTGTTIINEGTLINNGTLTISGGSFTNNGDYTGSGAYTGGVFVNPAGGTVNPGQ